MVTPSDGLWWRCLMLPPCWIALSFGSSISIGGWPLLAIPLAGWIAGRHGARALPAIALALAPMAIQYHANVAGITVHPTAGLTMPSQHCWWRGSLPIAVSARSASRPRC
jgi:hypothetical protein